MTTKPPKKKRCKVCKKMFSPYSSLQVACSLECAIELANKTNVKARKIAQAELKRAKVASVRKRVKEIRTRAEWFNKLQILVNQYVRWRDRHKPCPTCGTNKPGIKYDAGHFHTTKARPDIRFELKNINKQCNRCNVWGAGKRNEHEKFIAETYGQDVVDWLAEIKPPLKEQFPHWTDIEKEIVRYRELLRIVGVKPNA